MHRDMLKIQDGVAIVEKLNSTVVVNRENKAPSFALRR